MQPCSKGQPQRGYDCLSWFTKIRFGAERLDTRHSAQRWC